MAVKKNKRGRPLKFKSVKELQEKIDKFFHDCDTRKVVDKCDAKGNPLTYKIDPRPYTITGMALALDCDPDTLLNYEEKEEFFGTIKRAKLKCYNWTEEQLHTGKPATGPIFSLKNNYGWKDKSEVDQNLSGDLSFAWGNQPQEQSDKPQEDA